MTTFSIRDAAREAGVSKTSILRAIQSGRLSAPRKDDGGYAIDPAELFRVYEPKGLQGHVDAPGTRSEDQDAPPPVTAGTAPRTTALEAEIQGLKELVRRLDLDKQDLKSDRDAWRHQAETAQRLLSVAQETSQEASRGRWWGLFRRSRAS